MRIGLKTDKGKVREQNEDSYGQNGNLFVVADGMGGHQAGEIASAIAVSTILATDFKTEKVENWMEQAISRANMAILEEVNHHPELTGMGTTVAVLLIQDRTAYIAHVGDSRIYVHTDQHLRRLTKDHSLVAQLVENGEISESEARLHPQRNILTQALGSKNPLNIGFQSFSFNPGDKFLLCSDGLSGMVEERKIEEILAENIAPQTLAERLVALANENGGSDNITVVVVEV